MTTYDPYDRPVKVVDNRLTMNNAGDDRASYFVYNETGNLIKELGPVLRSADTGGYKDDRRPYAVYQYDVLGRLAKEQRLVNGTTVATRATSLSDTSSNVAVTKMGYDLYDRLVKVTDPEGYETAFTYDGRDNLISETRVVWKKTESDYSTLKNGFDNVTTYYAYDAAGRVTKVVDPRGNASETSYDALGNPVTQKDARGVVTHVYAYTGDGLLEKVAEPNPDLASVSATGFKSDGAAPTNYTITKKYSYGSRRFPSSVSVAHEDKDALTSGATTSYAYDWAGRATTTTLPDGATITQSYDTRGNLTSLTDAKGFVTTYTYDDYNRLTLQLQPKRTAGAGKTIDDAAFGGTNGLRSSYTYDVAGNLTTEGHNYVYTHYTYNSLGKVMAEVRPEFNNSFFDAAELASARRTTYRLDGVVTARTTYDFASSDWDAKIKGMSADSLPTVTAGNITAYSLDKRGLSTKETSWGTKTNPDTNGTRGAAAREYTATFSYDGLGRRVKRNFDAFDLSIYFNQRKADGSSTNNADYLTYWKYDPNGNLARQWDTLPDGTNEQNVFTYDYSATNKETNQTRNVQVKVKPSGAETRFPSGLVLAATTGGTQSTYNARDLVKWTRVTDPAANKTDGYTETTYSYFNDGHREKVSVTSLFTNGSGYQEFRYDLRGREVRAFDSNNVVRIETSYPGGGVTKQTLYYATSATDMSGACRNWIKTTPTVGGLVYQVEEEEESATACSGEGWWRNSLTTTTYTATGQPKKTSFTGEQNNDYVSTYTDYTYDSYDNLYQELPKRSTNAHEWKSTVTYYYTANNDLRRTVTNKWRDDEQGNRVTSTSTDAYTLDSRGNRLEVAGGWVPRLRQALRRGRPHRRVQAEQPLAQLPLRPLW